MDTRISSYIGRGRGIQGLNNSCYLDTTLFSLFYTTKYFDGICDPGSCTAHDELEQNIRLLLTIRIIKSLRNRPHFCSYHQINTLRFYLAVINTKVDGQMMDIDEFLGNFFGDALHLPKFLNYDTGTSNYLHQILVGGPSQAAAAAERKHFTVQALVAQSMRAQGLELVRMPEPAFIVKMPRAEGRLARGMQLITPNPMLDFTDIVQHDGAAGRDENSKRMELLAVICIRHRHYTSYVRDPRVANRWLFFNSMAPSGDPEVTEVHRMAEWLSSLSVSTLHSDIADQRRRLIPEPIMKLLEDVHVCIYIPKGKIEACALGPIVNLANSDSAAASTTRDPPCTGAVPTAIVPPNIAPDITNANAAPSSHIANQFQTGWDKVLGACLAAVDSLRFPPNLGKMCPLTTDYSFPHYMQSSYDFNSRFGRGKGIQHFGNSSLIDATIYALLSQPSLLDPVLLNFQLYESQPLKMAVSEMLFDIAVCLRNRPYHCPAFKMNALRNLVATVNVQMIQEKLEVDELLRIILNGVFEILPFIKYNVGTENFIHYLLAGPSAASNAVRHLQDLLLVSLQMQCVLLAQPPLLFLIKLPSRTSGDQPILPNIKLSVPINGREHTYWLQALICYVKDVYVTIALPDVQNPSRCFVLANSMKYNFREELIGEVREVPELRKKVEKLERGGSRWGFGISGHSLKYVLHDCRLAIYTEYPTFRE